MNNFSEHKIFLKKKKGTFGFFLVTRKNKTGVYHLLENVIKNGPAWRAGLKQNDQVLEINGKNVSNFSHYEAAEFIRKSGDNLFILVRRSKIIIEPIEVIRLF